MKEKSDVLIVGAGPTGLVLALELARLGVPFKLIDKAKGPGDRSRAMLVVPKVLESYQKHGIDQEVLDKGIKIENIFYHKRDKRKAQIELGHMGRGKSAYSFILTFPQDAHEQVLNQKLKAYGKEVEWETELVSLKEKDSHVEAKINTDTHHFTYVIGCDGASSRVRKEAGLTFDGDTYEEVFYVMDAKVEGDIIEPSSASFSFSGNNLTLFFPLKDSQTKRIIGMFPPTLREKETFTYEAVKEHIENTHKVTLHHSHSFSRYAIHRRLASRFRTHRVFLAGDAAHIHSPVGGQGMNAGIGDAVNLGWKLASVIQKKADPSLLDTYETERKAFAQRLVSTTDRAFKQLATTQKWKQTVRDQTIPLFAQAMKQSQRLKRLIYTVISQLSTAYEPSALNQGQYGKIKAGMRLPYSHGETQEFKREDGWQLHVFQKADEALIKECQDRGIQVVQRKWTNQTKKNGFKTDGYYLVRPDGHIGWVGKESEKTERDIYKNQFIQRATLL